MAHGQPREDPIWRKLTQPSKETVFLVVTSFASIIDEKLGGSLVLMPFTLESEPEFILLRSSTSIRALRVPIGNSPSMSPKCC